MLKFFYIDYKTEYFYWDVLECMRKLLLTGIAVLFVPGSMIQAAGSVAVIGIYTVAIASLKPYEKARDNTLAIILYSMQGTTMFVGLLLKMKDGYESSGKYDDGFSTDSMVAVLISTIIIVMISAIGGIVNDLWLAYLKPLLRYQSGSIVLLPPLDDGKDFDVFLSHAQNLGQDQVAIIKLTLEQVLPEIKIFLDVEALDDLHELDELVRGSRTVLVFLTQGCLRRHFVRLEVNAAAKFGVPTILVQETDPRHGSVPMLEHRNDCPAGRAREHLFGEQAHKVILWYRTLHYKFTGIRQIVQQLLAVDSSSLSDMVFPGEVAQRVIKLPPLDNGRSKHFYLLDYAPWCAKLKHTLESGLPGLVVELAEPGTFVKSISKIKAGKHWGTLRGNMVRRASVAIQNLVKQVGRL
jgi:hypothetical protein